MYTIGRIDRNIYSCITKDIVTDEVVLTDNQMQHILEKHPEVYEKIIDHLGQALIAPDYIIEDRHENTGLIIKRMEVADMHMQLVLRICTSDDISGYKNSIISCWTISERRLQNYLRNKKILYKKD